MTKAEYTEKHTRMEELLALLTEKGELPMVLNKELDDISKEIATYEENNFPFEVESLKEMRELNNYQKNFSAFRQ
ncbi:MAG TPA: hypothetical protein PLY70_05755 [Saprospiraceae bacterium]|nr:hypothetical protein [Saprospiraceae bacterium]HPN69762.1 hypothetical protein [Saprospiraceae bacterium]